MRVSVPTLIFVLLSACDWSPADPATPVETPDAPAATDTDGTSDDGPIADTDIPGTPGDLQDQTVETTATVPEASDQQSPIGVAPGVRPARAVQGRRVDGAAVILDDVGEVAYVADAEAGAVLRVELATRNLTSLPVGAEPTRVARIGQDLFVTLRGTGELIRLTDDGGTLREVDRIHVGAEPFDIAVSRNGDSLYVSVSQEDAVVAVDASTLEVVGRWSVPGEPKGLVSAPQGEPERVWVGTARWSRVREVTPSTGTLRTLALPTLPRFQSPTCVPRTLRSRITGDLEVKQDALLGLQLMVPALFADTLIDEDPRNVRPGPLDASGVPREDGNCESDDGGVGEPGGTGFVPPFEGAPLPSSPYGQPAEQDKPGQIGRFTPTVVQIQVDRNDPAFAWELGTVIADPTDRTLVTPMRSSATSIALEGGALWAVSPGMGALTRLDITRAVMTDVMSTDPETLGQSLLVSGLRASATVGAGAVGVAVGSPWGLVVWSFLDREVVIVPDRGFDFQALGTVAIAAPPVTRIEASESTLPLDVQVGRRLFWSASSSEMSARGSGASCETCHSEGRNDGFTWRFADMPRQSISLVGGVSATAPVTWLGDVASVADEVHATSTLRMGGSGLSPALELAVAAYVDSTRQPIRPALDSAAVARGREIFERADVACATCHVSGTGSDGDTHVVAMMSVATNTPALHGIGGSAPYFHDGSSATLADVVERSRDASMGDTSGLTDAERADLVTYLQSL